MHYTHCLWGISGSRYWPQNDLDCNDEHAPNPVGFWTQCLRALSRFFPLSQFLSNFVGHSHYHPIKVTVEAFLSPYLSPISQKLQTSYKLLWIVREKLFRLTRRNMASLHAHRCDTIAFLVVILFSIRVPQIFTPQNDDVTIYRHFLAFLRQHKCQGHDTILSTCCC